MPAIAPKLGKKGGRRIRPKGLGTRKKSLNIENK
jgi:hypothetical protein